MLAPKIESSEELGTKVTLYKDGAFARMSKEECMDAVYWHACLKYAQDNPMQTLTEKKVLEVVAVDVVDADAEPERASFASAGGV